VSERDLLRQLVKHIAKKHRFHTLILYGSHARGGATRRSDYDLLAVRKSGESVLRDARWWRGVYIDLLVYPEKKLKPSALLQVKGGKVLMQKRGFGDRFLAKVDRLHARGPKPLPLDELQARRVWARKMLGRIRGRGIEAEFRRVWLLTSLLEDYFQLRGKWYEGPKLAFEWLRENDPQIHRLFQRALKPPANRAAIKALVEGVIA
jgi:uncharacterized protein